MAKETILIISRNQEEYERRLKALELPGAEILAPRTPEEMREAAPKATIIVGNPPLAKAYINDAKNVKWMQSTFAGVDALNDESLRKDYMLTNIREVYGKPLAEYTLTYLLHFRKEVAENMAHQDKHEWGQRLASMLSGQTLCVVGAGSIGKEIAKLAKAFGMRTVGYRTKKEAVDYFDEMYAGDELHKCLAEGDYVVSVLPRTPQTDNFFNAETFGAMKDGAIFLNEGRGNAVDDDALVAALKSGKLSKAVLDVFHAEPLPAESPLWDVPNLYITPHMAGYIFTDQEFAILKENYRRYRAGEPLMYQVDLQKGY